CCSFHATPSPETHTLSLHDALPISEAEAHTVTPVVRRRRLVQEERRDDAEVMHDGRARRRDLRPPPRRAEALGQHEAVRGEDRADRKSTRLNSSHLGISYAVFCLKK